MSRWGEHPYLEIPASVRARHEMRRDGLLLLATRAVDPGGSAGLLVDVDIALQERPASVYRTIEAIPLMDVQRCEVEHPWNRA